MIKLELSEAARADLVEIRLFSIQQFGADVADEYYLGFDAAFNRLQSHPRSGQMRSEFGKDIRCITHRKHRIFYRISGDLVLIIRIIHHARNARRELNQ